MAIKVNTTAVLSAAGKISETNIRISNEFNNLESRVNSLHENWKGVAADHAVSEFSNIRNKFYEPRYKTINNFVRFMYDQVSTNYEDTESSVDSLADMFK